jgi:hypothetical protein
MGRMGRIHAKHYINRAAGKVERRLRLEEG